MTDVLQLGDMTCTATFSPKMMKALAVVAVELHPSYDRSPDAMPGNSKESCLFSSLAVRDYLVAIGFKDATVRGCASIIRAVDTEGKELHSLGNGVPGQVPEFGKFNGHAVVVVPSERLLIDTTMYRFVDRNAWRGVITGMAAVPLFLEKQRPVASAYGNRSILAATNIFRPDRRVSLFWIDRPELQWKRELDFRVKSTRRKVVTDALIKRFGPWEQ